MNTNQKYSYNKYDLFTYAIIKNNTENYILIIAIVSTEEEAKDIISQLNNEGI